MTAIREIRVKSLKALADVRLELGGLTVLVGSNGTGKSTLLEALELLRAWAHDTGSAEYLGKFHGGMHVLARQGENSFVIESTVGGEDPEQTFHYQMKVRGSPVHIEESATTSDNELLDDLNDFFPEFFTLHDLRRISQAKGRALYDQIANIDVHLPFDVGAGWATLRHRQGEAAARKPNIIDSTRRLERFGANLASAYHTLKNELGAAHWRETFELVQLGLGRDVIDVSASAFGGGHVSLSVEFASIGRVPAFSLADGVLTYLAFVALTRLDEGRS
ncbi:MAG: AAA family ATPase, partial [Myxococcales bacterium]|nr:AAA family ATPase [Myxococcales bacterium]